MEKEFPNDVSRYSNPGVRIYFQTHEWDDGWVPVSDTSPLKYVSEYLPTDTALDILKENSPLVDIGAGTAYWSEIINRAGGDCIPIEPDTETRSYTWCDVENGTHEYVKKYPNRNVLLCHPPGSLWTVDLLDYMNDEQRLIYVGDWNGQDGITDFFDKLREEYHIVKTFEVVNWKTTTARGYVFESNGLNGKFSWGTNAMCKHLANANPYDDNIESRAFRTIYDRKHEPYYLMIDRENKKTD